MKKSRIIFFFLMCFTFVFAQEEIVVVNAELNDSTQIVEVFYQPENETLSKENRETTVFQKRNLDPTFKDNYSGSQFDYDRVVDPPKNFNFPSFNIPVGILKILMYVILAIIVLVVIYFILKNMGGFKFGKEKVKIQYEVSEESDGENLDEIELNNFELLIQKAKAEGNFRRAIRFYYLWVLQKLADRKLIIWHKDKTDFQYLLELNSHNIREDFSQNTYIYDHIWYGNFELSDREFELAEIIFQRTLNKLN